MSTTWIVVASRAGARILESNGPGQELRIVSETNHPEGRLKDQDLISDKPGRAFDRNPAAQGRHATEPEEAPHERVAANFARALAGELRLARTDHKYDRLVLVAEPKFLGRLRSTLDDSTATHVVAEVARDLAPLSDHELRMRLTETLRVELRQPS